jgi:hypothetical protein
LLFLPASSLLRAQLPFKLTNAGIAGALHPCVTQFPLSAQLAGGVVFASTGREAADDGAND